MTQNEHPNYLPIWPVYWNPTDYPGKYVARLFHNMDPQDTVVVSDHLEVVREHMLNLQLVKVMPVEGDPANLVEVWI